MKKILIALSSLFLIAETLTTYGQTKVTAPITRNSPLDLTYGTHIDTLGYGGLMVFTSIANRDATPAPVRKAGMIAVVQDSLVYQLQGGITNADWVRVFFTGGAGGGFFANNGLTFTANLLQISGPLVKSTAIQNGAFNFNINGPGNYNTVMFAPGATTFVHALNNGVNPTDKESVFYQPGDAIVLGSTTKQARDSGTYYARSIVVTQADDAGTSFIGSWYPQQIDPNTAPPILPDHTTYVRTSQTGAAGTGRIELYGKTTYFNGDSIQVNTARYASGAGYVLTDVAGNGKLTMQPGSTPSSLTFQQTLNNSDVITKNDTIVGPTFSMNFNTKVVVSKYDTATTQPEFMWVARGDTMAKFPIQSINPNCQSRLISGSVIWDNLLIFHSTAMNYFIGCRNFTAPAGNFTLAPAYPANDRTDIWVVDTLGTISVITGSISGLAPQPDPASQLQVASVFIPAGATTPQDIINTTIYKENHPGEWVGATNIPGAIFDQTTFPFAGDSCTYVPSFTNGQYVTYQATTGNEEDFTQASFVYFYLRLSAPMTTGNMNFSLYLNTGPITAPYTLINGQNGFNQNTINQYQLIAIPASAFTLNGSGTIFNQLNITFTGTGGALRMDNIILQKGGSSLGSGVIDYTGGDGSTARSGHVVARATDYIWSYNSSAFNGDTTYQYHYNSLGILLDSVWVPKDPIFAGTNMNIRDTTVLISGNPVRGYIFDAITGGSVLDTMFQWSVLSIRNTPVVLADTGAHYLVGTTPTGAFTGHANQIAIWTGTVYTFTTAAVGDLLYNVATDLVYQWTGTQWVIVGLAALHQGGDTYGAPIVWGSKDYNPTLSITNSVMSYAIADSTVQNTGVGFGVIRNLPLTKMSSSGVSEGITAIGFKAAGRATTLSYSTALGTNAMAFSTTGGNNTALGAFAMFANTVGTNQVAVGYGAMQQSVTAVDNTAVGYLALSGVLTGQGNVAVGNSAMLHNTSGQLGTAVGISALQANTTGDFNTAVGRASLVSNTTGTTNTATGMNSLFNNTIGNDNAGFGTSAGFANTTGSDNTFLGYRAGNYVSGSGLTNDISNSSIYIGSNSRAQQSNQTNQIVIGTDVSGLGSNTALYGDSSITLSQIMGQVKVPTYGAGSHVAAPAYALGVLANGTIIEFTPGGGGGGSNNIYNIDSVLAGNRLLGLNGFVLEMSDATTSTGLTMDPTVGSEAVSLHANDQTGGGNIGFFQGIASPTEGRFNMLSQFDGGTKQAKVLGVSNTTTSIITYTADQNTVIGRDIRLQTGDGTGSSVLEMEGVVGDFVGFNFTLSDGTGPDISLIGTASDSSIKAITPKFFVNNATYNAISVDVPSDTIAFRLLHAGGAESLVKIGDNSTTPIINISAHDPTNHTTGDYSFQSSGMTLVGISADDNLRTDAAIIASFISFANTNTASGASSSSLSGINISDGRPFYSITTQGVSTTSFFQMIDSSINLTSTIVRLNTTSNGPALTATSTGQVQLNAYGAGTFNTVALRGLGVDGSGDIVETAAITETGTATLVAGTITVMTGNVDTNSKILVTVKTPGGVQGFLSVPTIVASTSFTINSSNIAETSTVFYTIINH